MNLQELEWKRLETERQYNMVKGYTIAFLLSCLLWGGLFFAVSTAHSDEIVDSKPEKTQIKGIVDDCSDPKTLPENMKKAYYQLKEAGFDVKAVCK